jgi:hypothetical protein
MSANMVVGPGTGEQFGDLLHRPAIDELGGFSATKACGYRPRRSWTDQRGKGGPMDGALVVVGDDPAVFSVGPPASTARTSMGLDRRQSLGFGILSVPGVARLPHRSKKIYEIDQSDPGYHRQLPYVWIDKGTCRS